MSEARYMMAQGTELAARPLSEIEYEIHFRMENAAGELLGVGRCLAEVRDGNLVPDGKWTEWVQANTGISVRSAQRLMQAAREVQPGSALEKLSVGKIQALLALPADKREEFAARHDAESKSVRELNRLVADERAKREAAERAVKQLEADVDSRACEKAKVMTAGKQLMLERIQEAKAEADEQLAAMRERILILEQGQMAVADDGSISESAQAEIDRLNADVERQSKLRADAQAEVIRLRKEIAQGGAGTMAAGTALTCSDVQAAASAFIGRVGTLPHMALELAGADSRTREAYRAAIDMVAQWCTQAREALDSVKAEVIIHD